MSLSLSHTLSLSLSLSLSLGLNCIGLTLVSGKPAWTARLECVLTFSIERQGGSVAADCTKAVLKGVTIGE